MHISFAVFADAANLSQEGKLNVLGIFDALHVSAFPSMHPRAHFVVRVKGSPADSGTHQLTFRWMNPRDAELWTSSGELAVEAGPTAALEMDLPLDAAGQYTMRVELDGEPVARTSVFVNGPAATLPYSTSPILVS